MIVSLEDQAAECEREVALRRRVYARWVQMGKMTERQSNVAIARMEAAARTLRDLADKAKPQASLFGGA